MAGKEATLFLIDVGVTTATRNNGRDVTDLDYGMQYIWDRIAVILSANKASHLVGVIGFRTDETNNHLSEAGDEYGNIYEMKELAAIKMPDLKYLQQQIKSSATHSGDAVSAIVVGTEIMGKATTLKSGKPGAYTRKMILLTDGKGHIAEDELESIAAKLNEDKIALTVIGIDFDDAEFGFKEEDKSDDKKTNEAILKNLVDMCTDGTFGTAAEAIESLSIPNVKPTRPYATYKGKLKLGDTDKYPDTAMSIDIERYFRTKAAPAPSASSFVLRSGTATRQSSDTFQGDTEMPEVQVGGALEPVRTARKYVVRDDENGGKTKVVDLDELAKGYEYGRTAVHISESDEQITTLATVEGFEIIGFIPNNHYDRFLTMGESCVTIAARTNDKAAIALSSFIHALHELESYAVARFVGKDRKVPQMLLLAPLIEPDFEGLIDVPIPFAEDVRAYRFPPLDRVLTLSGVELKKHRDLPTKELSDAMSAYVDSMDISSFGKDDDGNQAEYMAIEDTYSPTIHRINQAIRTRAVRPEALIGAPAEVLVRYSKPPAELVTACASELKTLVEIAHVTPVEARVKGTKRQREAPISGLDIDALLAPTEKRHKISKENPVGDFRRKFTNIPDGTPLKVIATEACKELGVLIHDDIKSSLQEEDFEHAYAKIGAMREEMLELEEPGAYNDFMLELKTKLFRGDLGEDGRDFFYALKSKKLGLISVDDDPHHSKISAQEAKVYLRMSIGESELPNRSR